jgi:hypothetical protein
LGWISLVTGLIAAYCVWWGWGFIGFFACIAMTSLGIRLESRWNRPNVFSLEEQIAIRDPGLMTELWPDPIRRDVLQALCRTCVDWHHQTFIPDDPCSLVMHPHTYLNAPTAGRLLHPIYELTGKMISLKEAEDLVQRSLKDVIDWIIAAGIKKVVWHRNEVPRSLPTDYAAFPRYPQLFKTNEPTPTGVSELPD